jgi:hypothetical protein
MAEKAAPKRCYYEILGVERTATQDELKIVNKFGLICFSRLAFDNFPLLFPKSQRPTESKRF